MEIKYILKTIRPLFRQYVVAIIFGIVLNFFALGGSFLSSILVDQVIPSQSMSTINLFIVSYLCFFFFRYVVTFFRNYLFSKYGYRILYNVRGDVFSSIISKFNFQAFTSENQGYIITLFKDWLNSISWFLSNVLLSTIVDIILLVFVLLLLAMTNIKIFCAIIITLPVYGVLCVLFNSRIRETRKQMMDKDAEVTQNLKEALDNIREIRALNAENIFVEKYNKLQKEFCNYGLAHEATNAAYSSIAGFMSILGHAVIIYYGGIEVYSGQMTLGTLIMLNSIVALLYGPVEKLVGFNRVLQVFKMELSKLQCLLEKNISQMDTEKQADQRAHVEQQNEEILLQLCNISFSYGGKKVLEDTSLNMQRGKTYAFVGENGSGKSTLINIIVGLLPPDCGNVFFYGMNIQQNLMYFHKNIGYVPQDGILLNASIRDNITFGRSENSDIDLDRLLELCDVDKVMAANAFNLDTIVGEKGNKLSGGQKQKIALCRALYGKPKILIIDEGTANIDSDAESKMISKIKSEFPDLTIILVSHRLSSIRLADKIFVLQDSRILDEGDFEQLLKASSVFNQIFSNQLYRNKEVESHIKDRS